MIISDRQCNDGNLAAFVTLLAVRACPGQQAAAQQIGAVYVRTVQNARDALDAGEPLPEPQTYLEEFASTGAEGLSWEEGARASAWGSARAKRLKNKGYIASFRKQYVTRNRYGERSIRRKYYTLTTQGQRYLQALENLFDLAYWMKGGEVRGLTITRKEKS